MLTYVAIFLIGAVSGAVGGAYALWKMADTALKNQDKQTLRVTAYYEVANQWVRNLHEGHRLSAQMVEKGYKRIIGEYLPTPKNKMVEQHYPNLGFANVEGAPTAQFFLDVDTYEPRECYIERKGI